MKKLFTFAFALLIVANTFAKDRPIITNLEAHPSRGNKISLSWKLPANPDPAIQKLFVYRSSKPIGTYYDISEAILVSTLDAGSLTFNDTVKNYNDYYYAIIAQVNNGKYDIILPSVNATVNGTHLLLPQKNAQSDKSESAKEKLLPLDALRERPLPFLNITKEISKKPLEMSAETKASAAALSNKNNKKQKQQMEPYIFEEDLVSPDGGDDFLLFEILRTTFIQKKYKASVEQLTKLLGTNRSKSVTKRTTFYLAEAMYYTNDYNNAVRTFLQVYDDYPLQSKKWIDATLDEMKKVEKQ